MRIRSRISFLAGAFALAGTLNAGHVAATPLLQMYAEGATHDGGSENGWYVPGREFRLWVIGNLTGPGGSKGLPITNVRLAAVYDSSTEVSISITPTLIGGTGSYGNPAFNDPSLPAPVLLGVSGIGTTPLIGGNHYLPNHGEYGDGKTWQEFTLSDFTTADSQLGDFAGSFPIPGNTNQAQIHAYDVRVTGGDAHFDLYAQITDERGRVSYHFAPPAFDITDGPEAVPLPATLALLGIGALGLAACRRQRRSAQHAG